MLGDIKRDINLFTYVSCENKFLCNASLLGFDINKFPAYITIFNPETDGEKLFSYVGRTNNDRGETMFISYECRDNEALDLEYSLTIFNM